MDNSQFATKFVGITVAVIFIWNILRLPGFPELCGKEFTLVSFVTK